MPIDVAASDELRSTRSLRKGSVWSDLAGLWFPLVVFLVAYGCTTAIYGGDTLDYVDGIEGFLGSRGRNFFDFGHLLWRGIGYSLFKLAHPFTSRFVGNAVRANIAAALLILGFLGGTLCAVLLYETLLRLQVSRTAARLATTAFVFSNAFLNYAHTGCAYVPGLAGIVVALFLFGREDVRSPLVTVIGVGAALSYAVACWFPFVLAVPAVLLMPLTVFGASRERWKLFMLATAVCATIGLVPYVAVAVHLHLHNPTQVMGWISGSSHGVAHRGTVPKVLFGFARSWFDMGNQGVLFKRYLLHDPYNPVSRFDLLRLALTKFALFYFALGWFALRSMKRQEAARPFILLAIAAIPVVGFGYYWEAGATERYLAVFPFLLIAGSSIWRRNSESRVRRSDVMVGVIFVLATVVVNGSALYRGKLEAQERVAVSEMNAILPSLPAKSHLVVQEQREEILKRDYFLPQDYIGHYYHLVETGHSRSGEWRQEFAKMALTTWSQGGEVWVTKCFLSDRPTLSCNWTEGDDKNLSWRDLQSFLGKLDKGRELGGSEGFVLIPQNSHNYALMRNIAAPWDESRPWDRLW
jgi:hypothetical protein